MAATPHCAWSLCNALGQYFFRRVVERRCKPGCAYKSTRDTELLGFTETGRCQFSRVCTRSPTTHIQHATESEKPVADPLQVQGGPVEPWSPKTLSLRQEKRKAQHKTESPPEGVACVLAGTIYLVKAT